MKRILVIGLAVVMCLSMSVTAFAANGAYLDSPSKHDAPVVVEAKAESTADADGLIITVTPFSKRDTLTGETAVNFNKAHESVVAATKGVLDLTPDLQVVADAKKIPVEDLAVSDLFDVSANKKLTDSVSIKLKAATLKNFVALIHYTDDAWEIIDSATVSADVLTFKVDSLSPFAVVVDTKDRSTAPLTSANGVADTFAFITIISALGVLLVSKKVKA